MKILCHRGYWKQTDEKNTIQAFERGYALGLGTETDIRDFNGQLVISHDPASADSITFSEFLGLTPADLPLALNVKADGLVDSALAELKQAGHKDFFFFDMSVPDMLNYFNRNAPTAVRLSEYEPWIDVLMGKASAVWLDSFEGLWYDASLLNRLSKQGLLTYIVSSELHGRDPEDQWSMLEQLDNTDKLVLCTDLPEEALSRFANKVYRCER